MSDPIKNNTLNLWNTDSSSDKSLYIPPQDVLSKLRAAVTFRRDDAEKVFTVDL